MLETVGISLLLFKLQPLTSLARILITFIMELENSVTSWTANHRAGNVDDWLELAIQ